ncbi:MAG: hypothetical protein ACPHJ3_02490 [Rubripirellula sp.]
MFTPQRCSVIPSLTGYECVASKVCVLLLGCLTSLMGVSGAAKANDGLAQDDNSQRELPSLTLLGNESRKLLRQEAVLKGDAEKNAAATALCDMYVILRLDSRYSGSKMLQGDATQIRRRLISIAKKNEKRLTREGVPRPPNLSSEVSASITAAMKKYHGQADGNQGDQKFPADGDRPGNPNVPSDDSLASQGGNGGNDSNPAAGQNAQRGWGAQAAGGVPDTGWRLVELIQRVIAPDFWDSRGGPGSIRYFAMRKVLVIRATTDIHEQVRDLLTALR